ASTANTALRIGHEQVGMRQLVHAESAAGAAGALRIVEDEVDRPDVAVREVMRSAGESAMEAVDVRLGRAFHDLRLHQPVTYEQRGADRGLDRLLVFRSDDDPI